MLKGYGWVGGRLVALKILETPRVKIPVFYLTLGLDLRLGLGLVNVTGLVRPGLDLDRTWTEPGLYLSLTICDFCAVCTNNFTYPK